MPKPKMSPLKSTRMKREGTGPKSSEEGAPTLAEVLDGLSDFAQSVGEGEVALAQLDEVLKTVARDSTNVLHAKAEKTVITKGAGLQMSAEQAERVVEVTGEREEQGADAPMLPLLSLIHISEPTRRNQSSRMPSSA